MQIRALWGTLRNSEDGLVPPATRVRPRPFRDNTKYAASPAAEAQGNHGSHSTVGTAPPIMPSNAETGERQRSRTAEEERDAREKLRTELMGLASNDVVMFTSEYMVVRMRELHSPFDLLVKDLGAKQRGNLNARVRKFKASVLTQLGEIE